MTTDPPAERARLETRLRGLVAAVDAIDASRPLHAMLQLNRDHPLDGADGREILALCRAGLEAGWLAPRAAGPGVRFGRFAKDMGGYSVDVVVMEACRALGHTHTNGEINMCFALEGQPRFDGHEPGWVVFPPGSHHVPTVTGGTMLFVYFMPGGEVVWDPAPS